MHGDRAETDDFQADPSAELLEGFSGEIKQVSGRMDLTPLQALPSRQQRTEVARGEEQVTARLEQLDRPLEDLAGVGEMLDGIPKAYGVKGVLETLVQQISFPRVQTQRPRMRDAGGENIDPDRAGINPLDQLEKKAVGAADFEDATARRRVASDDPQMVSQGVQVRRLVGVVIDVFAPLEIVVLVESPEVCR